MKSNGIENTLRCLHFLFFLSLSCGASYKTLVKSLKMVFNSGMGSLVLWLVTFGMVMGLVGTDEVDFTIDNVKFCESFSELDIYRELELSSWCNIYVKPEKDKVCLANHEDLDGPPLQWTCRPAKEFQR